MVGDTQQRRRIEDRFRRKRLEMVDCQLIARGVTDERVLAAMRQVPRERFVAEGFEAAAYEDRPLPIGQNQTISQPFIVGLMADALRLRGGERVLEVGAGSGYAAAVLGRIAKEVYAVERHAKLARRAAETLAALEYDNIEVVVGDGSRGLQEHAPFDAIVVAASGPDLPESLLQQLAIGGRLVMPVGPAPSKQELIRVTRKGPERFERESLGPVRFVPLVGREGWNRKGRLGGRKQ